MNDFGSKEICAASIRMALTKDRASENELKAEYAKQSIKTVAVDFGSEFGAAVPKIIERAVVAAKREGVINDVHAEEGAVAGAAHEALQQIIDKCVGLNIGGKIGIARHGAHISVCLFFTVSMLNLNDVVIGLGHRAV